MKKYFNINSPCHFDGVPVPLHRLFMAMVNSCIVCCRSSWNFIFIFKPENRMVLDETNKIVRLYCSKYSIDNRVLLISFAHFASLKAF